MDLIKGVTPFDGTPDELDKSIRVLYKKAHQTIKKVTNDIEGRFHFNTAISAVMELVNTMYGIDSAKKSYEAVRVMRFAMESVILLLSPIVPHLTEELWGALGHKSSVFLESWPSYREDALLRDSLEIVVQVNGKLRSRFSVSTDADDAAIKEMALSDERASKFINNKPIKRVIVVKKKLVNIVV